MGVENLAPTGIRSPDRPARSKSLYRLSYPDPLQEVQVIKNNTHRCVEESVVFDMYLKLLRST
jgi:hypothetical protein